MLLLYTFFYVRPYNIHSILFRFLFCHLMFKTIKYIVYFNCVLLPHMFIFQHIQIELFHVLFLLYPFQIDLNRSNYRVVIRTNVCTRICFCLFNTVSKSGVIIMRSIWFLVLPSGLIHVYFRLFGCVNHLFFIVNFLDWQNYISFSLRSFFSPIPHGPTLFPFRYCPTFAFKSPITTNTSIVLT